MKKGFNVLLILFVGVMIMACSKSKSYTDMLNAEKKAINRLIDREDLEIIKKIPADSKFEYNQYVKLDNDVYLQIVDTGDGRRAVEYSTRVFCRFTANRIMIDSTTYVHRWSNFGPHSNGTSPVEFTYGHITAIPSTSASTHQADLEAFMSEGIQAGLKYVGNKGQVRLIVPFKIGSTVDNSNGWPVHFEDLQYSFD